MAAPPWQYGGLSFHFVFPDWIVILCFSERRARCQRTRPEARKEPPRREPRVRKRVLMLERSPGLYVRELVEQRSRRSRSRSYFFPGVARKTKAAVKGACSETERRRTGKEPSEDKCEGHQSAEPFLPHCGLHLRLLDCR